MPKPSDDLQIPSIKWLTPEDFEFLCFDMAREWLTYKEPIPDYSSRDNALLESALGALSQTFDQKLLYPILPKQATVLFYSLIKNHPFQNGNKRIAVMGLLTFLALNTKWVNINPKELYELACRISESLPDERNEKLAMIEESIVHNLTDFPTFK